MKRNLTREIQKMTKSESMIKCLWKRAGYHFVDVSTLNNDEISKGIYIPVEMATADTDILLRAMLQHGLLSVAALADADSDCPDGVIALYQTKSQLKIINKNSNPVLIDESPVVPVICIAGARRALA